MHAIIRPEHVSCTKKKPPRITRFVLGRPLGLSTDLFRRGLRIACLFVFGLFGALCAKALVFGQSVTAVAMANPVFADHGFLAFGASAVVF